MKEYNNDRRGFIRKREQFALQIRKQNRDEILEKSRNLQSYQISKYHHIKSQKNGQSQQSSFKQSFKKLQRILSQFEQLDETINEINSNQRYDEIIRNIQQNKNNFTIQNIIDCGEVYKLVKFARQDKYTQLQFMATWILAKMTKGSSQHIQFLIQNGAIQLFSKLIQSPMIQTAHNAIWAIGNIGNDSSYTREVLINKGVIQSIKSCISKQKNLSLSLGFLWSLSCICKNSKTSNISMIKDAVQIIVELLTRITVINQDIFVKCCWTVSDNFDKFENQYEKIINKQFIYLLLSKLNNNNNNLFIIVPILRIINNVIKQNRYIKQIIQNQNTIVNLYNMLYNEKKTVRIEICDMLANIVSHQQCYIDKIMNNEKLIEKLFMMFCNDCQDVKKQICYLFGNFTSFGDWLTIGKFYKKVNIVKYYISVFQSIDSSLVLDSLENLYQILKVGEKIRGDNLQNPLITDLIDFGGIRLLQQLQLHKDQWVYNAVMRIIKNFCQIDQGFNIQ